MLQLHQRLVPVRDLVLFAGLLVHGFFTGNKIVLTFSSLSISAYVSLPSYSKIGSQPAIYQILILCKTHLDVHLPNFPGPLGRTIAPCTSQLDLYRFGMTAFALPWSFPGKEWALHQGPGRRQRYTQLRQFCPRSHRASCSSPRGPDSP